jgi:hypothetical protein
VHATKRSQLVLPLAIAAAFGASTLPVLAQDDAAASAATEGGADRAKLAESATLFVHNVMIAKPEPAVAAANAMLAEAVSPSDLANAVDGADLGKRMDEAFRRSRRMAEVSDAASALEAKLEAGRQLLARKIDRIEEAVKMLAGPMRGQMLAKDRLTAAGEYAVPALLRQITEGRDLGMEAAATRMLVDLRRQSALPLALTVASLDAASQRKVCVILGQLGYPVAVPFLLDLAQAKGTTPDVSEAAMDAVRALGGSDEPAHAAYAAAAKSFLAEDVSLAAYPSESMQNIWKWTDFGGLAADKVSTTVYYDVMAMALSRRALELDAGDEQALATFVAADLRRESRMSEGTADPLFAGQGRSAQFYATASGPKTMQDVLQIGLDLGDAGIIRSSLAALRETAGARAMVGNGSAPVVKALDFADRRVRFEAAITLASVTPADAFSGSDQVVPVLAQAVRGGGQTFAGIISRGGEDAQRIAGMLRSNGFVPLTAARDSAEFGVLAARNAGADLVVIAGSAARIRDEFVALRETRMGSSIPVVVVAQPADKGGLDSLADDGKTVVLGADISDDAFKAGVDALSQKTMGARMGAGDSSRYVGESIDALTRIGLAGGSVYKLADAEAGLVDALRTQEGAIRASVASILAMIDSNRAQRAVIDAALAASGDEQVMLLGSVAQGARRFGSKATSAQSDAVRELVRGSTGATADAAAAAFGALSLPSSEAVDLIIKSRVPGKQAAPAADAPAAAEPSEGGSMEGDAPADPAGDPAADAPMGDDPAQG